MYWAFWKFCIPIMIFLFVFLPCLFSSLISSVLLCLNSHFFSFSHFQSLGSLFFPPDPLCLAINTSPPFYCCAPFNISAFLLAFFWVTSPLHLLCGQVAGQLAHCIHVPEMEITQEMFDEAMQFNTVQADPIYSSKNGLLSVVWTWKLVLFSAVFIGARVDTTCKLLCIAVLN